METHDHIMFHHSFIEADRAARRRDTIHAWLVAALVVTMFGAGVFVGFFLK